MPQYPSCHHRGHVQCRLLTMGDIKNFHAGFYAVPEKAKQDAFILKYCRANPPKRSRKQDPTKVKSTSIEYTIQNSAGNKVKVCRETFLSVLNITKHRVLGVFNRFKKYGSLVPVETRGGSRKEHLFKDKKDSVISFIKGLTAIESHYQRGKSERKYLQSDLNIAKLWIMYNSSVSEELKVKEWYFRNIFNTRFNVSFTSPSTDECSTCLELNERLRVEKDEEKKSDLLLRKALHRKQAKSFFEHLKKKDDDCLLLSFDCQKNLVLPKLTDQAAYYSRQIYCYNLTVVTGLSTNKLEPGNVSIYTWTENEGKKSSNEVASIVYNELNSKNHDCVTSVRLVADGCGGQNKNVNVLLMCAKWLLSCARPNLKSLELVFPITGHSFLPSDRVFGLIEKDLKSKPTITKVDEYHAVFAKYGTVKVIGEDWTPHDWKEEAKQLAKTATQLHFPISQCRKIVFRRTTKNNVLVRGELAYNIATGIERPIMKKGTSLENVNPREIPIGVKVKQAKIVDIERLLSKHYGTQWKQIESLQWYKNVIDANDLHSVNNNDECECLHGADDNPEVVAMQIL